MAVTAKMVKELREMTGAGMMDCKKALNETDGDMDAAIEFLRKNGEAKAVKKAGRIAAEGIVMADVKDDKTAAIVEVNSETDFVAKNETFQEFVQTVADTALASDLNGGANGEDIEALLATNGLSDLLVEKTATIGEKLSVPFIIAEMISPGISSLFRPIVEETRMLSVAPTQSKSSIFMIRASWAIPFHTDKSPVSFQYM